VAISGSPGGSAWTFADAPARWATGTSRRRSPQPARLEAELASDEDAGCGCAYPDYVGDDVVDRSNQIITRLRATAGRFPGLVRRMGELPRYLTVGIAGQRVGIVHGDPESLAGWRLDLEAMEPGDPAVRRHVGWRGQPTTPTDLLDWFGRADVSVLASTHTGLPYAQSVPDGRGQRLIVNNGAAVGALRCDAVALRFHLGGWKERFLAQWPPGSPGHRSYFARLTRGTHPRLPQAARAGVQLRAASERP
jgi:hypothetical protein